MEFELDVNNKQEIALQFLLDARDYLEFFEILIINNKTSARRHKSTFISKASVDLLFSIECSLKCIFAIAHYHDNNMTGECLIAFFKQKQIGHNIPALYLEVQSIIAGRFNIAEIRLSISDRYAIETLAESINDAGIQTLQWDKYLYLAQSALKIAEKEYAKLNDSLSV